MFGYVMVNKPELKIKEFDIYKGYYCGLCDALKRNHGLAGRITLNYDMVFIVMLLTELYECPTNKKCERCIVHPIEKHDMITSDVSDYCADMCVYLAYHKCLDDWNDEHKISRKLYSTILKKKIKRIEEKYPEKTEFIRKKLDMLYIVEKANKVPLDKVAKCFGEILGTVFQYKDDFWKNDLYKVGFYLGKFIYMLDAYEDIEKDIKSGDYNPYKEIYLNEGFDEQVTSLLLLMIGECTDAFERLPLVENVEIMRNILYSGVWQRFSKAKTERMKNLAVKEENGSI